MDSYNVVVKREERDRQTDERTDGRTGRERTRRKKRNNVKKAAGGE